MIPGRDSIDHEAMKTAQALEVCRAMVEIPNARSILYHGAMLSEASTQRDVSAILKSRGLRVSSKAWLIMLLS